MVSVQAWCFTRFCSGTWKTGATFYFGWTSPLYQHFSWALCKLFKLFRAIMGLPLLIIRPDSDVMHGLIKYVYNRVSVGLDYGHGPHRRIWSIFRPFECLELLSAEMAKRSLLSWAVSLRSNYQITSIYVLDFLKNLPAGWWSTIALMKHRKSSTEWADLTVL